MNIMTNNFFLDHYTAALRSEFRPGPDHGQSKLHGHPNNMVLWE